MWKMRNVVGVLALAAVLGSSACGQHDEGDSASSEDQLRLLPVSTGEVDSARRSHDPTRMQDILYKLASDRTELPLTGNTTATRVELVTRLFARDDVDAALAKRVRAAYISAKHGIGGFEEDPEITIRSDGFVAPVLRLDRVRGELAMLRALNGAEMEARATTLADMVERALRGSLTMADRQTYFAMLPLLGLWDAPVRVPAGDTSLDALERRLLREAWTSRNATMDLDAALRLIEDKLPAADLSTQAPRGKSVAVIASSHGAQWQELMGWAMEMVSKGYHLQVFTPEGRPVAMQRDSLSVSVNTASHGLGGFGCPLDLDPAKEAGRTAMQILGNTAPAAKFNPSDFGAVYLAGGLGFNEDVAVATEGTRPNGNKGSVLRANPNIAAMMHAALGDKLPIIAICHGPTLLAVTPIEIDGESEPLNKGIATASLPPFESYVQLTARKEIQFTWDVNTHETLSDSGGSTDVIADVANMQRVVKGRKADIDIITGPGPQAASALAAPTIEAIDRAARLRGN